MVCSYKDEWGRLCPAKNATQEGPDFRWLCEKHRGMQDAQGRLKSKAVEELVKVLVRHTAKVNAPLSTGPKCDCEDCLSIRTAIRYLAKDESNEPATI